MALACVLAAGAGAQVTRAGEDRRAPDPGGKERAIVAVPPPGERYLGIHEPTILGPSAHGWKPRDVARIASQAGMELVRFTVDWTFVEPSQDQWDEGEWARYEAAYDAIVERGMRPLIGVATAPPWARDIGLPLLCGTQPRGCEYPPRPGMLHEWAEFVREVALRFPRAAAIEIWNEPDISNFWKPEPQPRRYAALVASSYDAIKAVRPGMTVLAGALAGARETHTTNDGRKVMAMREFLQTAYRASPGLAGHMDGLSFHQANQSLLFGPNSSLALAFRDARWARARFDTRKTPLWITEFGLSTSDTLRPLSPAQQADGLLRAYRKVITIRDVRAFVLHTLADDPSRPATTRNRARGVGIISSFQPFVPKRAYCEFAGRLSGSPNRPCRAIRESHVSACTRRLIRLRGAVATAPKAERPALRRRLRAASRRCIPSVGKLTRLKRAARRAGPAARPLLTRKQRSVARRSKRCRRRLVQLQRSERKVVETLRLDVLNQHEKLRRRCR